MGAVWTRCQAPLSDPPALCLAVPSCTHGVIVLPCGDQCGFAEAGLVGRGLGPCARLMCWPPTCLPSLRGFLGRGPFQECAIVQHPAQGSRPCLAESGLGWRRPHARLCAVSDSWIPALWTVHPVPQQGAGGLAQSLLPRNPGPVSGGPTLLIVCPSEAGPGIGRHWSVTVEVTVSATVVAMY